LNALSWAENFRLLDDTATCSEFLGCSFFNSGRPAPLLATGLHPTRNPLSVKREMPNPAVTLFISLVFLG
jgi:hypothetical protein